MGRSKLILSIVVAIAAAVIIWRVGFHSTEAAMRDAGSEPNAVTGPEGTVDSNAPSDPNEASEAKEPSDANEPAVSSEPNEPGRERGMPGRDGPGRFEGRDRPRGMGGPDRPGGPGEPNRPGEPNEPSDPNDRLESVNLKDFEVKNLLDRLAEWTGKAIVPSDEAMKTKITIYAKNKVPRKKALDLIYGALLQKGIVAEYTDGVIYLKSLASSKLGQIPTISAEQPLAAIENKDQVVQKFFTLKNYGAAQMGQIVQPLIGDYGYISADENTRSLLVIDTVGSLMRIERIIEQFDVPEAEQGVTEVIEVSYGDPSEIVQMLNILLGETVGRSRRYYGSRDMRGRTSGAVSPSGPPKKGDSKGQATSVVITGGDVPVVLIPEPRRKWIIAKASANDMKLIKEWIKKLDKDEPVEPEHEIIPLRYAQPYEVENAINDMFRDLPGTEFLPSVMVQPLQQTKQVIVFGRKDLREMIKNMIAEIDIPPGNFETRDFPLKYADPDQIKANIEELFSGEMSSSRSSGRYGYSPYGYGYYNPYSSRGRSGGSSDMVKVISYVTLKQVTVITSPEKMKEVAAQIAEWDKPLDIDAVKPRIIDLKNSDPVQMADLLNTLFAERTTGRSSLIDILLGRSGDDKQKIIGPLYGQLTFEDVPGTKKIIVISKIPEAYDVIEQLVLDLDREEMAEVPKVIQLKYADPEDLSERLNAMFVEGGQQARIRRTMQGLSEYSMEEAGSSSGGTTSNQGQSNADPYTPPWSGQGARRGLEQEMPISNVIGRIRFVPDPHTKSILVLSPPEFLDEIRELIAELDRPGKQVMLQAIIMEIEHSKLTSIGVQFATDPAAFGGLGENAITALGNLTNISTRGSADGIVSPTSPNPFGAGGTGAVLGVGTDVYALIDFLVKKTNAKILNQQTLWTKDNEEASFFKGSRVAFLGSTTTGIGVGTTQSINFENVGMTLRARPSITPESSVDMVVNVIISQLTPETVNDQRVRTVMDTTTNMIVQNGQTLLLGGILFQKDSIIERKVPGLGDIPGIGGLFRHNDVAQSNNEMMVFITPHVVEDANRVPPQQVEDAQKRLNDFLKHLDRNSERVRRELPSTEPYHEAEPLWTE